MLIEGSMKEAKNDLSKSVNGNSMISQENYSIVEISNKMNTAI